MDNDIQAGRIRAFRKLKGFTQNELAEKIGVSVAVLGSIERGTRRPDAKLLRSIADALGINKDEIAK
jgi:transcriptional regulator with XRE-family HTH domain